MDDSEFEQHCAQMRRIFRGDDTFGEGHPAEQATRFRRDRMLPDIVRRARARTQPGTRCSLLISLSGFSPETTILAWEILRPRSLLILSSDAAGDSIDVIYQHLMLAGVRPQDVRHDSVDPADVRAIANVIGREINRAKAPPSETIVDITGGKKLMSAAGALAASERQLRLAYIDSDYDPELRAPRPGTERLVLLDRPTAIFAGEREAEARALFDGGSYAEANARFTQLADTLAEPGSARLYRALAGLYSAWMDLDFDRIAAAAVEVRHRLDGAGIGRALAERMSHQADWLERLATHRKPAELLLGFFVLGRHYRARGRHDFAALLFYRTLEGVLVERVRERADGFDPASPDYRLLTDDVPRLAERFATALGGAHRPTALPVSLGFLDSAALLVALEDALVERRALGRFRALAGIRNASILAHGTSTVSESDATKLEEAAAEFLARALGEADFEGTCARLAPIRLAAGAA